MAVKLLQTRRFGDSRGWFTETFNRHGFATIIPGIDFRQDNHSFSALKNTLRGLHFQRPPHAQAKLVRCTRGSIFDVAVDLRRASPTFGRWEAAVLSADAGNQLFIPAGFAHGFLTLEEGCEVQYKVDTYYAPQADAGVAWNDTEIGVAWPLEGEPVLSDKDCTLPKLREIDLNFEYDGQPLLPLMALQI